MDKKSTKFNKAQVIRSAIEDRAAWLFFLYKEIERDFGKKKAEELSRKAIHKFGYFKAVKRGKMDNPGEWVKQHFKSISRQVFKSKKIKATKTEGELQFYYCPLVESWKKLGATKKEIALLCDISMQGDRGRGEVEGFEVEVPQTIGRGAKFCRLILKLKKT